MIVLAVRHQFVIQQLAHLITNVLEKDEASAVRRLRVGIYVKNIAVISLCSLPEGMQSRHFQMCQIFETISQSGEMFQHTRQGITHALLGFDAVVEHND